MQILLSCLACFLLFRYIVLTEIPFCSVLLLLSSLTLLMSSTTSHIITSRDVLICKHQPEHTCILCNIIKGRPLCTKMICKCRFHRHLKQGQASCLRNDCCSGIADTFVCSHLHTNGKYYIYFCDGNGPLLVTENDLITACILHMWWNGCLA